MNRDRQMKKDMENKQAQARDEYAKNKQVYKEIKTTEKATDYVPHNKAHTENTETENDNKEKE